MRHVRVLTVLVATVLVGVSLTGCAPRRRLAVGTATDVVVDATRGTPANCAHGPLGSRTLPVSYWFPAGSGPFPLLVFAHGFNAGPGYYASFLEDLASAGYIVAAPTFPISAPGPCPGRNDLADQTRDITAVITRVQYGPSPVSHLFDGKGVGVLGHSDGGMTAGLMSHVGGYHDARVRAYAVLSGAIPAGYQPVGANAAAVLAVNGEADTSNSSYWARDVYRRSVDRRGLVLTSGGSHTSPYLGSGSTTTATRDAIVAFIDWFVRLDPSGASRFNSAGAAAGEVEGSGW